MGIPRISALSGVTDGVNSVFTAPQEYTPGTFVLLLNGVPQVADSGPYWAESDPTTGEITITDPACIPISTDQLAGFYIDTLENFVGSTLTPITGVIKTSGSSLFGVILNTSKMTGQTLTNKRLQGVLGTSSALNGSFKLSGKVLGGLIKNGN